MMADPPQGDMYKPLSGDLFPKNYPVDEDSMAGMGSFFFSKNITFLKGCFLVL